MTRFMPISPQGRLHIHRSRLFWNPLSKQCKVRWQMIIWPEGLPKKGWVNA